MAHFLVCALDCRLGLWVLMVFCVWFWVGVGFMGFGLVWLVDGLDVGFDFCELVIW